MCIRDSFNSALDLFKHVEQCHHPRGDNWQNYNIRAYSFDDLQSVIDCKNFGDSLVRMSIRDTKHNLDCMHNKIARGMSSKNRRPIVRISYFEDPSFYKYSDPEHVQQYHRTLSLCYLLEDNIMFSTQRHLVVSSENHKILALRDYLHAACQVIDDITEIEPTLSWAHVRRLGMFNAIRHICDAVIGLPY